MAQAGLLQWSNEIRRAMASDPGRQLFADQIQKDGFLFLDDYLDNILSGAKQDGLIDLVKTPSRNRTAPRQPKTASKLKNIVAISFEATSHAQGKENVRPPNLFPSIAPHKNSKPDDLHFATPPPPASPLRPKEPSTLSPFEAPPSLPVEVHVGPASPQPQPEPEPKEPISEDSLPMHTEVSDLSVIAEDEEPLERSTYSINHSPKPHNDLAPGETASMTSMDTFHSIPLDSPSPFPPEHINTGMDVEFSPISFGTQVDFAIPQSRHYLDAMDITEPLPTTSRHSLTPDVDALNTAENTAPLPSRQSVSQFPILPAPMQLQKTPGAALGGKRTSWLKKAREAKALDVGSSKQSVTGLATNPLTLPGGLKRKSSDFVLGGSSINNNDEGMQHKASKKGESDVAPLQVRKETPVEEEIVETKRVHVEEYEEGQSVDVGQLRKTMEGFNKTRSALNKSLGGAPATALAEARAARAAAEARVVENYGTISIPLVPPQSELQPEIVTKVPIAAPSILQPAAQPTKAPEPQFSLAELVSSRETNLSGKEDAVFHKPPSPRELESTKRSSPALSYPSHDVPVFQKPQPVFRPPSPKAPVIYNAVAKPLAPSHFSMPASMSIGLGTRLPSPTGPRAQPLSKHSTLDSVASESIFDSQGPASTQDTDYGDAMMDTGIHSIYEDTRPVQILDEDDSWPLDEKMADGDVRWTFGAGGEEDMSWSDGPTASLNGSGVVHDEQANVAPTPQENVVPAPQEKVVPAPQEKAVPAPQVKVVPTPQENAESMRMDVNDAEVDNADDYLADNDVSIDPSKMTVSLVDPSKNQSQASLSESTSTNTNTGFLPRFVNSFLGKKTKPEVKSLQLAAAAKKEQESSGKKEPFYKTAEARRQQAAQKKAEEEQARLLQEEKKIKEENERRKKEREEHTGKRPLVKPPTAKKDDGSNLKKQKKPELKKAPSKVNLASSTSKSFKPTAKPIAGPSHEPESKPKPTPSSKSKMQTPAKARPPPEDDISQPSQMLHSQMAARAQAQINAAANVIPSESIELPDINSEYSDSDDEDRVKYQAPHWAQSPALRRALEDQADINPDEVFGPIQPLNMEDVFRTRLSRFRARTSSANWAGADRLTEEEELEYARRMGFRQ
ncbi:hypothetical protein BDZ89DRAFT_1153517 [Hymenopellis radicata]|nr:hypothetical protein BDZ89DRAFT_1153517 [Hymenopellis radicata]